MVRTPYCFQRLVLHKEVHVDYGMSVAPNLLVGGAACQRDTKLKNPSLVGLVTVTVTGTHLFPGIIS